MNRPISSSTWTARWREEQGASRCGDVVPAARLARRRPGGRHLGGAWPQFEAQVLAELPRDERLARMSLLPTCGTKSFAYEGAWRELIPRIFSDENGEVRRRAANSLQAGFKARAGLGRHDRRSREPGHSCSRSASRPLWTQRRRGIRDFAKPGRSSHLDRLIPEFSVRMGGRVDRRHQAGDRQGHGSASCTTSSASLWRRCSSSATPCSWAATTIPPGTGVQSIQVRDPDETKQVIETLLASRQASEGAAGHERSSAGGSLAALRPLGLTLRTNRGSTGGIGWGGSLGALLPLRIRQGKA